jgi:hypothetical protein
MDFGLDVRCSSEYDRLSIVSISAQNCDFLIETSNALLCNSTT